MQTVDDIVFDAALYASATDWTLLLCEKNGVSVVVPLENANLMSFVQVFDNIAQCEQHVEINLQKLITLFTVDDNVQQWLANADSVPSNLQHIKIVCDPSDRPYIDGWSKRYMNRFRNITFEIVDRARLNYRLLLFGVDLLKNLDSDFQPNSLAQMQLQRNYKRVCHSLANYFWHEANA